LIESETIAFHGGPITWFGDDAVSKMLAQQCFTGTCMIISDRNLVNTQHFREFSDKLLKNLQHKSQMKLTVLEPREPSLHALNNQLESFRDLDITHYIGYGGGSVMDSAKVFRAIKDSNHSLELLLGDPLRIRKRNQLILIPTTAGTGSEMSPIAVFEHNNEKVGLLSYELRADVVAVRPKICATCPRETVESSGIDALAHALESTISNKANFFSRILSPPSLQLIYRALRKILEAQTPSEEDLMNLCKGIMLSSVSYGYAGCCGIHALAYPVCSRFHIRHGQAVALFLLPVLRYYFSKKPEIASHIRPLFHNMNSVGYYIHDQSEYVIEQVNEILSLCSTLPKKLNDIGVKISDLPLLARQSQKATILLKNSPVPIGESQAQDIYTQSF